MTADTLKAIKNYLDITYDDAQTDEKLEGIARRGEEYLNNAASEILDYEQEGTPRALLFDYCRYARNNALEMFETNFRAELLALRIGVQVKDYAERQEYL